MQKLIKKETQSVLKGHRLRLFSFALLAKLLCLFVPTAIGLLLINEEIIKFYIFADFINNYNFANSTVTKEQALMAMISLVVCFILYVILSPIWMIFTWMTLDLVRGIAPSANLFILLKKDYSRILKFQIIYFSYIFFWSLLFVIPGLIKRHSYAIAPFLLRDNPEITAIEAIRYSQKIMEGKKLYLFNIVVSFMYFYIFIIYCMLIFEILVLATFIQTITLATITLELGTTVLITLFMVYFKTAIAVFYEKVILKNM